MANLRLEWKKTCNIKYKIHRESWPMRQRVDVSVENIATMLLKGVRVMQYIAQREPNTH